MAELTIIGDVRCVLEGRVKKGDLLEPPPFQFALGAGTFTDETRVGETLILASKPHVSWLEKTLHTESNPLLKSPFLVGLTDNQSPTEQLLIAGPISLSTLYEKWVEKYPFGCALVGICLAEEMVATYLKKPPISGENINDHHDTYWGTPDHHSEQMLALFGILMPPSARTQHPPEILNRIFYHNPNETSQAPFDSHTHAAILATTKSALPQNLDQLISFIEQSSIQGVRHLITSTQIQTAFFALYPLDQIK